MLKLHEKKLNYTKKNIIHIYAIIIKIDDEDGDKDQDGYMFM